MRACVGKLRRESLGRLWGEVAGGISRQAKTVKLVLGRMGKYAGDVSLDFDL